MNLHLTSMKHKYGLLIKEFVLSIFICLCLQSFGQDNANQQDSTDVVETINQFVHAFSNLEWDKFTAFFADDATAFFPPSARFLYRANSKQEIEKIFKTVFEHAKENKSSPPYIIIEPRDIKIQMAGSVAIVSFTLNDPGMLGRRTFVLKKEKEQWLIIHLHASGVPV